MLMSGVPDGTVMSNNIHTFRSLNMRDRICWTNFFRCSLLGMRWMISNNNFLSCWKIKIFNIIMKFYIACRIYTMITAQDEVTRVQKYSTFTISTKFQISYSIHVYQSKEIKDRTNIYYQNVKKELSKVYTISFTTIGFKS